MKYRFKPLNPLLLIFSILFILWLGCSEDHSQSSASTNPSNEAITASEIERDNNEIGGNQDPIMSSDTEMSDMIPNDVIPKVVKQDTLVSAFFGLDNALPFKFPLEVSSLSATDFEVLDSLGNIHTPMCALLAPANENRENRTVLLLGEFGTAVTNPPVEVRVVGDLFTIDTISGESACSEIINLIPKFTRSISH